MVSVISSRIAECRYVIRLGHTQDYEIRIKCSSGAPCLYVCTVYQSASTNILTTVQNRCHHHFIRKITCSPYDIPDIANLAFNNNHSLTNWYNFLTMKDSESAYLYQKALQ